MTTKTLAEADARRDVVPIDLALQGGGAHGAFTWGVLDYLLEVPWLRFDAISGTSAGAMNAAVMADPGHSEGALWAGMRIHRIESEAMTELNASSKLLAEWGFFCKLRDEGRRTAAAFMEAHGANLGVRSTFDLDSLLLEDV